MKYTDLSKLTVDLELAMKLNLKGTELYWHVTELSDGVTASFVGTYNAENTWNEGAEVKKYPAPTLSELIEACGEEVDDKHQVYERFNEWLALNQQ